jgi:hypothetical protein
MANRDPLHDLYRAHGDLYQACGVDEVTTEGITERLVGPWKLPFW